MIGLIGLTRSTSSCFSSSPRSFCSDSRVNVMEKTPHQEIGYSYVHGRGREVGGQYNSLACGSSGVIILLISMAQRKLSFRLSLIKRRQGIWMDVDRNGWVAADWWRTEKDGQARSTAHLFSQFLWTTESARTFLLSLSLCYFFFFLGHHLFLTGNGRVEEEEGDIRITIQMPLRVFSDKVINCEIFFFWWYFSCLTSVSSAASLGRRKVEI